MRALPISVIFPPLFARLMPRTRLPSLLSTTRAAALVTAHHLTVITPSANRHDSSATWLQTRKEPVAFRSVGELGHRKVGPIEHP